MEDEQWIEPHKLPLLKPRLQWFENHGYSGETALITAGMYYGQYCSQYTAREVASMSLKSNANTNEDGAPSQCEFSSRCSLDSNAVETAEQFRLACDAWSPTSHPAASSLDFLQWVKGHVLDGHPVAIGVYANKSYFEGDEETVTRGANRRNNAGDGDSDYDSASDDDYSTAKKNHALPPFPVLAKSEHYDHTVLVYGVSISFATPRMTKKQQCEKDVIYFYDHGLWGKDKTNPPFSYCYTCVHFQASREKANTKNGCIYSVPSDRRNHAIAFQGVVDPAGHTVPVRLQSHVPYEEPAIAEDSNVRPVARPLTLTITLPSLEYDVAYNLYRYDAFSQVPRQDFNAASQQAVECIRVQCARPTNAPESNAKENAKGSQASTTSYSLQKVIQSNETVIFRAVRASAP